MRTEYHIEITTNALQELFSKTALELIIKSNISQDRLRYQIWHDYIHFDGNAFKEGFDYIDEQNRLILENVQGEQYPSAWEALGRMTHSWQDYYSHSNYIKLWLDRYGQVKPEEINHQDNVIMNHPDLRSGKNYGLLELMATTKGLSKIFFPLIPPDSHAKMNLDGPDISPLFEYAYWAALKQTQQVAHEILGNLGNNNVGQGKIRLFTGK